MAGIFVRAFRYPYPRPRVKKSIVDNNSRIFFSEDSFRSRLSSRDDRSGGRIISIVARGPLDCLPRVSVVQRAVHPMIPPPSPHDQSHCNYYCTFRRRRLISRNRYRCVIRVCRVSTAFGRPRLYKTIFLFFFSVIEFPVTDAIRLYRRTIQACCNVSSDDTITNSVRGTFLDVRTVANDSWLKLVRTNIYIQK